MHPFLNIADRAARSAGKVIAQAVERLDKLTIMQKQHNDFVTDIDQKAEKIIIDTIRKNYPHHAILAEESGASGEHEFTWIIDPLDGTKNFMHGLPHFAVSIAVMQKSRIEHALVYDPIRHEVFSASRGHGAQLNNRRLRISQQTNLQHALLGTGFPYREDQPLEPYFKILKDLMAVSSGIRRAGAATLDLAYVAAGRLDGFWEFGLQPWDIAAGALLIKEAGGIVGDAKGGEDYLTTGNLVAGNAKIFKSILQVIHQHLPVN